MLLGGFEFVLLGLLLGAAAVFLAIISVAAIMECVFEYWDEIEDDVLIVAPEASAELQKIAREKASKPYKRFVYNPATKDAVLVESNSISDELRYEDVVTVSVR
ncbi:MAG TPA: hypothetical protein VK203_19240 [Nostocaceae cyanobacterium]|nr:hypothetical protein [Nostocaceae cyanobacterium]